MSSSLITIIVSISANKYFYAVLSANLDLIKLGFIFLDQWTHSICVLKTPAPHLFSPYTSARCLENA